MGIGCATWNLTGYTPATLPFFTQRNLVKLCGYSDRDRPAVPPEKPAERDTMNFRLLWIYHKTERKSFQSGSKKDPQRILFTWIKVTAKLWTPIWCVCGPECPRKAAFPEITRNGKRVRCEVDSGRLMDVMKQHVRGRAGSFWCSTTMFIDVNTVCTRTTALILNPVVLIRDNPLLHLKATKFGKIVLLNLV